MNGARSRMRIQVILHMERGLGKQSEWPSNIERISNRSEHAAYREKAIMKQKQKC